MMKIKTLPVLTILILAMGLVSCEEVIQLDLKNSEPRIVIEATLNATSGECLVQVSKSLDFYQSNNFEKIEGAAVELTNGMQETVSLSEVSPGIYRAVGITVSPRELFRLNVQASAGIAFSAETRAPDEIFLDSLKVVRGFGDPRPTSPPIYLINPVWKDPAGIANYYRFKVTTNGKPQSGSLTILSDESFDGTEIDMPLYRYGFELGDTVRMEFQSIDSLSFVYFTQINDMARPSFVSATPYNPIGNFDNGALGYFGIFFSETRSLIVSTGRL